jgi:hypothetical protein
MERSDLLDGAAKDEMLGLCAVADIVHDFGGKFCSWVGTFNDDHKPTTELNKGKGYSPVPDWPYDADIPWFTVWEYCWTMIHLKAWAKGKTLNVLSLGGNACLLDLALLMDGHSVTLVEQRPYAVDQQIENARLIGCQDNLRAICGKMEDVLCGDPMEHDAMTSTNVLFLAGEPANRAVADRLRHWIRPNGRAFFTFDFGNPNPKRTVSDPIKHFEWEDFDPWPSGEFIDTGSRHHFFYPDPPKGSYTAGALIQERKL